MKFHSTKLLFVFATMILNSTANADDLQQGKMIYDGAGACASCHGATGAGDGVAAAALDPKPRNFSTGEYKFDTDNDGKKGTENDIFNVVTKGATAFGGSPLMVARPDISEADRKALSKYVLSLKK